MSLDLGAINSREALGRIRPFVLKTPLLKSPTLTATCGFNVFLKCENLQHVNAFKIRGAENFLSRLSPEELKRGVVAFSSGNHAQGVALAAGRRKVHATIVMPTDSPRVKITRTRELGAEVVLYDRVKESREAIASQIATDRGSILIPSFDHPWIIEGQGTLGVELLEDIPDMKTVIVGMSGGGLASGLCLSLHGVLPRVAMIGIEPAAGNDIQLSLKAGKIVSVPQPQSLADGLLSPQPGKLTFPILKDHLSRVETVADEQLLKGVRALALDEKLIAEPSGAAAYAWLLHADAKLKAELKGPVVIVITGGNIEPEVLKRALVSGSSL
jgi:threo-3-hydroxy-L-aspartate ammonia-lyase